MRDSLYRLLLRLAETVKPPFEDAGKEIVWDGKHYLICTRCGNDEYIHDESCDSCNYIRGRGICWSCVIQDVMDGEKE